MTEGTDSGATEKDGCAGEESQEAGERGRTDSRRFRWKAGNPNTVFGFLILFASPFVMYGVFEWITGSLSQIGGRPLFWNLALFFLIYLAVFGVTSSMRIGYTVLNAFFTFWALAEYFVVSFRSRPILVWDLLAFRTAATVAGNYRYEITAGILTGVCAVVIWTALIWIFPVKPSGRRFRACLAAASAGLFAAGVFSFYTAVLPGSGMGVNMWDPLSSYESQGTLLSTMCAVTYLSVDPPEGYSQAAVTEAVERVEASKEETDLPFASESDIVPTNIICIMNESFSDLRKVGEFETDEPFLSFYDSLSENTVKGDLYVPVFGSMTCNSEFEFLTGNSISFAPEGSVPFQVYMRNPSYSLASILKNHGYRTVGIHPNERTNWNRDQAYAAMGFDEFYGIESFEEPIPRVRYQIADMADYGKIMELTESKQEGEPLFIFDVTMQNHGGYEEDWEATVHLTEYEDMPKTEQYLSVIRESDKALETLLEHYSNVDEPTMIVMFGDHQPAVEEEFFEALYGMPLDQLDYQDLMRRYITPFLIWTNYDTGSMENVSMSAQFLSGAVLERANVELTDYLAFLNQVYQATPVVHIYGYMRNDGVRVSWNGWRDQPEYGMYMDLWYLQYNNMFDKKRMDWVFGGT